MKSRKDLGMKKILSIFGVILLIIGLLIFIFSKKSSIGIIGGADGSTVLFIAGKAWIFPAIAGALLIFVSCVFLLKKKK